MTGTDAFAQAVDHYRRGDRTQAATLCREVLSAAPLHAPALHLLGTIEHAAGRVEAAVDLLTRAVAAQPDYAEAQFTLGEMLARLGRLESALGHFERAAALRPDQADPSARLGAVLLQLGRLAEADTAFRRALQLRPHDAAITADMAAVLLGQGKLDEAVRYGRRAVAMARDFAPAQVQLARALRARFELNALGGTAAQASDLAEAEERLRTALRLQPNYPVAVATLVAVLKRQNRLVEAERICVEAITAAPDIADTHAALADLRVTMGDVEGGLAAIREARRLSPADPQLHQALILYFELAEGIDSTEMLREARDWQERFAAPLVRAAAPPANALVPDRVLRVGYVGGAGFRRTPLYNVMGPIIAGHDREHVDVFCYSDLAESFEDEFSASLRDASTWRRTERLDDAAFAEQVRRDGIDILVDCVQFFPGTRMLALARRPAPVQVAFPLNATLGGTSIDCVIGDEHILPPDAERLFAETVLRIPIAHCYRGFEAPPPATQRPPSLDSGVVTFGSFNWLSKISPGTIAAWARILTRLPRAKLLIKCSALHDKPLEERLRDRFAALGVGPGRVEIRPWTATYFDHMAMCNEIDIVLDTFPYNGVTTTCDALWMGVPVITLVGQRALGRYGLALLRAVGFEDGITRDVEAYVDAACRLAADPAALAARRGSLQAAFRGSPVCDGRAIAGALEGAYRMAWTRHCARG